MLLSMCYRKPPKLYYILRALNLFQLLFLLRKGQSSMQNDCNINPMFRLYKYTKCTYANIKVSMGSFEVKSFEHVFTCLCTRLPLVVLCLGMSSLTGGDQHVQKTSQCTLVYLNLFYQAEYTTLWDV